MNVNEIRTALFAMRDETYKTFQCKLMPTVSPDTVIGIRTPELRAFSRKLKKEKAIETFLDDLPHAYYEENNLHAFLIEQMSDYSACMAALNRFLPYVDNWATCDSLRPKCFRKHTAQLLPEIKKWLASPEVYTVRFGIGMLMTHFLDEHFDTGCLEMVAKLESGEYYINMMCAWYFATALAKQYESTIVYLVENRLPLWVHNKTIQKAIESYRIQDEQKMYLRSLRR